MTKTFAERIEEGRQAMARHKAECAAEEGLTNHPKLDQLYQLAWDHGHAGGFSEVANYFREFAVLLK